ncbi:hypothetical protein X943_002336 [Babesia divergens]|uniref:Uncharacterized protein n=1 Tax=Babesia divergens TaxID=32595 RepID=A0AAD9GKY5_BABDI|nr:hypothetical protein X943_002336 [Babesia divergens]
MKYDESAIDPAFKSYNDALQTYMDDVNAEHSYEIYKDKRSEFTSVIEGINNKQEIHLKHLLLLRGTYGNANRETIQLIIKHDMQRYVAWFELMSEFMDSSYGSLERQGEIRETLKKEFSEFLKGARGSLRIWNTVLDNPSKVFSAIDALFKMKYNYSTGVSSLSKLYDALSDQLEADEYHFEASDRMMRHEKPGAGSSHFIDSIQNILTPRTNKDAWFIMDVNSRSILSDTCIEIIKRSMEKIRYLEGDASNRIDTSELVSSVSELETAISEYKTSIATVLETVTIDEPVRTAQEAEFAKLVNQFNAFVVKFNEIFGPINDSKVKDYTYVEKAIYTIKYAHTMKWNADLYKNTMETIISLMRLRGYQTHANYYSYSSYKNSLRSMKDLSNRTDIFHKLFISYYHVISSVDWSDKQKILEILLRKMYFDVNSALKDLSAFDKDLRAPNAPPPEHQSRAPELLELMLKLAVPIDATHNKEGDNTSLGDVTGNDMPRQDVKLEGNSLNLSGTTGDNMLNQDVTLKGSSLTLSDTTGNDLLSQDATMEEDNSTSSDASEDDVGRLGRAPSTRSNLNNAGDGFILSSVLLTTTSVLLMV